MREGQIGIRERLAHHGGDDALVRGIDVRVQQANRDCLDPFRGECAARLGDARLVQRSENLAGGRQPLLNLAGEMARHQRLMPVKEQIVGFGPVAAADDVDVARAGGDDQPCPGALALDQRVDGNGRAVDQFLDGSGLQSAFADAIEHTLAEFGRCGQALCFDEFARLVVEADEVGEGPADVDRDDDHRRFLGSAVRKCRREWERDAVTALQTIQFLAERNAPPAAPGSGAQSFLLKASWMKSSSIR